MRCNARCLPSQSRVPPRTQTRSATLEGSRFSRNKNSKSTLQGARSRPQPPATRLRHRVGLQQTSASRSRIDFPALRPRMPPPSEHLDGTLDHLLLGIIESQPRPGEQYPCSLARLQFEDSPAERVPLDLTTQTRQWRVPHSLHRGHGIAANKINRVDSIGARAGCAIDDKLRCDAAHIRQESIGNANVWHRVPWATAPALVRLACLMAARRIQVMND